MRHSRSEKISAALRQKRKEVALSHLRTKKQFEDLLKKRLTSLETLHSTLLRVEASAGDVEVRPIPCPLCNPANIVDAPVRFRS